MLSSCSAALYYYNNRWLLHCNVNLFLYLCNLCEEHFLFVCLNDPFYIFLSSFGFEYVDVFSVHFPAGSKLYKLTALQIKP